MQTRQRCDPCALATAPCARKTAATPIVSDQGRVGAAALCTAERAAFLQARGHAHDARDVLERQQADVTLSVADDHGTAVVLEDRATDFVQSGGSVDFADLALDQAGYVGVRA